MRDALHIFGLFAVFAFLALQFPKGAVLVEKEPAERAPFAEFVTLSPNAHAVYLDAARTSWQVKNEARSRPSIGRLDADVPLLSELLPPPSLTLASLPSSDAAPLPPPKGSGLPSCRISCSPRAAIAPESVSEPLSGFIATALSNMSLGIPEQS